MKADFERLFMYNGLPRMFLSHWLAAAMHATAKRQRSCGRDPMLSCSRITLRTLKRITREENSIWFSFSWFFIYSLASWPSSVSLLFWRLVELASSTVASSGEGEGKSWFKTICTYLSIRSLNTGERGSLGSKVDYLPRN